MKMITAISVLLATSPVFASECSTFTSEARPAGEVVAEMKDERRLRIIDKYGGTSEYDLISAGTGIPFQVGVLEGTKPEDGKTVDVRMHKGDLIIDMMVFTPFCN